MTERPAPNPQEPLGGFKLADELPYEDLESTTAMGKILGAAAEYGQEIVEGREAIQANKKLRQEKAELIEKSKIDALTGTLNKAGLQEAYNRVVASQNRYGEPPSTALFADLDDFAEQNRTLGHIHADKLLAEVAHRLQDRLRITDYIGRWGGDEFVVILHKTDAEQAKSLAEEIREAIGEIKTIEGKPVSVTASIGLGSIDPSHTFEMTHKRIGDAMYEAKGQGKNRVVFVDQAA